jgi:hypothetical protein
MPAEKLLFIDTNIWLDFYRARNDTGLKLLKQVEAEIFPAFHQDILPIPLELRFQLVGDDQIVRQMATGPFCPAYICATWMMLLMRTGGPLKQDAESRAVSLD